jgi:hypothetical protein
MFSATKRPSLHQVLPVREQSFVLRILCGVDVVLDSVAIGTHMYIHRQPILHFTYAEGNVVTAQHEGKINELQFDKKQ